MHDLAGLNTLVNEPREALDIEVKQWLNLQDNDHRAALAKEIIALANHGGGYILVGFAEGADGTFAPSLPRPTSLLDWSQDAIQSIVAKYVEPPVQCRVVHVVSSLSGDKHPVIVVPGGHRMPVAAKAGSPDGKRLVPYRVYIRRPGPNSQEPKSAGEWDYFFERCLQNRQAELLEAMRSIMAGVIPAGDLQEPGRRDQLRAFEDAAAERWRSLVVRVPAGASPRFPSGYCEFGFALEGPFARDHSLGDLKSIMQARIRNHSGWPPFVTIDRPPLAPKAVDGTVECWIGPDHGGAFDKPAHHDFWRASPQGLFYTRMGYYEDGLPSKPAGRGLDITWPARRLAEAVLGIVYVARALDASEADLICHARWTGLAGRSLVNWGNTNRLLFEGQTSSQNTYEAERRISISHVPDALPELVHAMIVPLYELFDFFTIPKRLVEQEISELIRHQF